MSTGSKKKRRIDRVTSVELPPGVLGNLVGQLRRGHVLVRLALCAITAVLLWGITRGWAPALPYHRGDVPRRDIVARTQFEREDPEATRKARELARSLGDRHLRPGSGQLEQLRAKWKTKSRNSWRPSRWPKSTSCGIRSSCRLPRERPSPRRKSANSSIRNFAKRSRPKACWTSSKLALKESFAPLLDKGVLEKLPPEHDANKETISVHPVGTDTKFPRNVPVSEVLTENAASALQKSLTSKMPSPEVADRVFARVKSSLPTTLKLNVDVTRQEQKNAAAAVPTKTEVIPAGTVLAHAQDDKGVPMPIDEAALEKLKLEYRTELDHRPLLSKLSRSLAVLGMYVALYRAVRLLHLPSRSADCRRLGPIGDAVGAGRGDRDADRRYEQRLAGRNGSADAVRHDRGDRL